MFTTLLIPDFALQLTLRAQGCTMDTSAALLDEASTASVKQRGKAPIIQVTPRAHAAGVRPGMTATQAQARCPGIALHYRDVDAESIGQETLLDLAALSTPDYESTASGVVTMDWAGLRARPLAHTQALLPGFAEPEHMHPLQHLHESAERLQRQASAMGFIARVGVAANPDLAFLVACLAKPVHVLQAQPALVKSFLSALPLSTLAPPLSMAQTLDLWGIRTLGAFTALPRAEITQRLGTDAARLWDMANGSAQRLLRLVRAPADYALTREFEHPIESLTLLSHEMQRMLDTLAARLASVWLVAREVVLTLGFENGSVHRQALRLAEPARDITLIMRLLHTHLESFTSPSPIIAVSLELLPSRPGQNQGDLFEHSLRDPNRFAETLAQLEALVGAGNVGRPRLLPSHKPDSVTIAPFFEPLAEDEEITIAEQEDTPAMMPLRRFRPALAAQVQLQGEEPITVQAGPIRGRIVAHRGPWQLSGDWWDRQRWACEEWDVQLADGLLCRLKRERDTWSVEGLYS